MLARRKNEDGSGRTAAGREREMQRWIGRAALRAAAWAFVLNGAASAQAQAVEDHSLPKSAVKTYHVKCPSGRLAMIRYDTRPEPTKVCLSVQDGYVVARSNAAQATVTDLA
jgi:hypothetical protein